MNFVDKANWEIQEFIDSPINRVLRCGTGSYSTPFRGTLFGETSSSEIAEKLCQRSVDVLWMGSNPNVPDSLAAILGRGENSNEIASFMRQRDSGKYSEHKWGASGVTALGWDPIRSPSNRGWAFYQQLLSTIGDIDSVAMANFVVWGSANFDDLLKQLAEHNLELLNRVLDFSATQNLEIIKALRPKLIVVPFSLGRNNRFSQVCSSALTIEHGTDIQNYQVSTGIRSFNFSIDEYPRGGKWESYSAHTTPFIFAPK